MNGAAVLLRGISEVTGLTLFLLILGILWSAAMVWCLLSCLIEGIQILRSRMRRVSHE